MRQRTLDVNEVKRRIAALKGEDLSVSVNKGRKKVLNMNGVIVDVFPSVFTFRATAGDIWLLYTSPSPRDVEEARRPSSG